MEGDDWGLGNWENLKEKEKNDIFKKLMECVGTDDNKKIVKNIQ